MKRNLYGTVRPFAVATGAIVDRTAFLSGVLSATVTEAPVEGGTLKVSLEHCETVDGTFEKVLDDRLFMNGTKVTRDGDGSITDVTTEVLVEKDDLAMIDIDLLGCKNFVKVNIEGTGVTASHVLVLGDKSTMPA